ncbi:MAG: hypothetical protein JO207_07100 [Verrucomicrobia bacterium]|nr:hypothetical protein [Verrucomicrobiota bacterium]
MELSGSEMTDPYDHETTEAAPAEKPNKLNISHVQPAQIEPQDAHWLRMDPSLTRSVLAKTEEELLGGLAALMRNKVEHEQLSRRLAQIQIDTQEAKHEFEMIRHQVRRAEEEVASRINEQSRINEEIDRVRRELAILRDEHRQQLEIASDLKNDAAQARQLLAGTQQRLSGLQEEAEATLAEHREVMANLGRIRDEKMALEDALTPLRTEIDARIETREAVIQQMTILEQHVSDLVARKEYQTAELSRLGSSHAELRDEIEGLRVQHRELSSEVDSLRRSIAQHGSDKERLATELANLQNEVTLTAAERQRLQQSVAEEQKNVNDLLAQKADLERVVAEAVNKQGQLLAEVVALESRLREVTEANEKAEQARREEGLPLLFGSELHEVSPSWNSYPLESEFHTDEELDAKKVAELVAQLPGLEGCLIVKNHGSVLASQLPERIHAHLKVPDRNYNLLFERLKNKVHEYNLPNAHLATFDVGDEGLTVAQASHAFLLVNHKQTKLRPGLADKLASIAVEVAKMYP